MSSVGGWKVEARDSWLNAAFDSSTVTGTPRRTRFAAATMPTGPAPAISTLSFVVMREAALPFALHRLDPVLLDRPFPLRGFRRDELRQLVRPGRHRFGSLLDEPAAHGLVVHRLLDRLVQLVHDGLRHAGRSEQREPAVGLVIEAGVLFGWGGPGRPRRAGGRER